MIKVNNGFAEIYYLTEKGEVYNEATDKMIKPDNKHRYKLKTTDNKMKSIALKSLYRLVYGMEYCEDDIEDLEGEQWRVIDRTDGIYWVSNKGRIKSYKGYKALVLSPYKTNGGYDRVDIVEAGSRRSCLCHRLVAASWLPLPESIDQCIHHKDFNKNNNEASNLEWLGYQEHLKKHQERSESKDVSAEPEENLHRENE